MLSAMAGTRVVSSTSSSLMSHSHWGRETASPAMDLP